MRTIYLTALLAALCISCFAQDRDGVNYFIAECSITQSTSAAGCTLQVPANAEKTVYLESVSVYCEASCTASQLLNGSTATGTTAIVPVGLNSSATTVTRAYSTTNSAGGSSLRSTSIPASSEAGIDYKYTSLRRGQAVPQNLTIKPDANMTGVFRVAFVWYEK